MQTIKIMGDVSSTLGRVQELKAAGLVIDRDFTWTFTPYSYNYETGETTDPYCEFRFQDEQYASLYLLRWV